MWQRAGGNQPRRASPQPDGTGVGRREKQQCVELPTRNSPQSIGSRVYPTVQGPVGNSDRLGKLDAGQGKAPPSKSISSPLKMRGGVEPKGAAGGGEGERAGLCPGEGPGASLRNKSEGMWSSAVTLSDPPAKITAEL